MNTRMIALRDLLTAYLEAQRPQIHPVMADHVARTLESFEAALQVKVPRDVADVPSRMGPLFMLFRGTVESLLALRTPLSGFLEAGLIITRLEEAEESGRIVMDELRVVDEQVHVLRELQLDVLEQLLQIFLGRKPPPVTMDTVRDTGLYPGDTPKDFDIFDHM